MLVFGDSIYRETSLAIYLEKEGKYIYLKKPYSNDNKEYRMNLSNGVFERINHYKTTGTKITEVKVANITKWFSGCSLFCEDKKFAKVIMFNRYHRDYRRYSSPVRFVQTLTDSNARIYESWLSIGIDIKEVREEIEKCKNGKKSWWYGRNEISIRLYTRPSDFSKTGLKYIKKHFTEISRDVIDELKRLDNNESDLKLFDELLEKTSTYKYSDFFTIKVHPYNEEPYRFNIFDISTNKGYNHIAKARRIVEAISTYNLNVDTFLDYCIRLYNVEGLQLDDLFDYKDHYNDYLDIERKLKHHKMPKMNKYPRFFLSTFHVVKREYNIMKQKFSEEMFKEQCDRFRSLEHKYKDYSIVVPEKTKEIEQEADELGHCVRIYIPRVIDGETLICFLRSNEDLNKPLVTIEVKDGNVTQAYGESDGKPKDDELAVIRRWAKQHKLTLKWAWD